MYITSRCVHGSEEFLSIKPRVVPPNTPITVRKVSKLDLMKRFHREVGLEPVVAYELDIISRQRCRRRASGREKKKLSLMSKFLRFKNVEPMNNYTTNNIVTIHVWLI